VRVLYLSQYFPPEMGAPAARVHELSREWVRLGHEVTVLTGFPNHPTGVIPPAYRGKLIRREVVDGIQVVRVPIHAAPNRGYLRRALNYLSYAASAALLGPFLTRRPDVLIATSPQFLTALAGLWLSFLKRVPFVFEVRDIWPQSIVEVGALRAGSLAVRILEWLERLLYRRADLIVPVTESFVADIAGKGGDRAKMRVITNGVDLELFQPGSRPEARAELGLPAGMVATYIGTHGMAHGLDLVLDAARTAEGRGMTFLLVGEGAEKAALKDRARRLELGNVLFWDQQPRERVARIVAASDACLVLLRDRPLFRTVIPSKMFEFMGAGRAMVSTVDGEARDILERAGAGLFVPPERPEALVEALAALAADPRRAEAMGQSGRRYVEAHYSRPALAGRYAEALSALLQRRRS
jgi:colanic acid biosynthesis glycosyl transferase WcaI